MFILKTKLKMFVVPSLAAFLVGMSLNGCKSAQDPAAAQNAASPAPAAQPGSFALFGPPPEKSGVQLWSENCSRCHNMRPPETFSDTQWAAIVHHMRLRANLTGDEARKITTFLQASN
jgi:hypothetical protein